MELEGALLHHAAACRIVSRYLRLQGAQSLASSDGADGVDIMCGLDGRALRVKIKADMYFGDDAAKIADRSLSLYRRRGDDYAFESISHHLTREPGWVFNSNADELYYYFLAIAQPEPEIAALLAEPDAVFFSELAVDRDELHAMPMPPLQDWFETNYEDYPPRPVLVGDHSAWYRLVGRDVLTAAVPIRVVGPVFAGLGEE